ncbi:MAG TPA: LemA family protein [bacterium]|nr:LemA family protein [bacterium]
MDAGMMIVIGAGVVLVVIILAIYNRLVTLRARVNESWSQIDVQLKRRTDLLPNLVETVKGYAKHEKDVFENVTKARSMMQNAGNDVGKAAEANNMITGALKSLFAVVENYPELKANENFKMLQTELSGLEDRIAYARQFFNESVRMYNEYQQLFPAVIFAGVFGHAKRGYFEIAEAEKAVPQVKF